MKLSRAFALAAVAAFTAPLTCLAEPSGGAIADPSARLVRSFASCEGRLAAEVRHNFVTDAAAASRAYEQREVFSTLLDAVHPDATAAGLGRYRALGWRITAGVAQDRLRRRARAGSDMAARRYDRALAEAHVAACRLMILGG